MIEKREPPPIDELHASQRYGAYVRRRRTDFDIKLSVVAEELGVKVSHLSEVELGRLPPFDIDEGNDPDMKLARFLAMDVDRMRRYRGEWVPAPTFEGVALTQSGTHEERMAHYALQEAELRIGTLEAKVEVLTRGLLSVQGMLEHALSHLTPRAWERRTVPTITRWSSWQVLSNSIDSAFWLCRQIDGDAPMLDDKLLAWQEPRSERGELVRAAMAAMRQWEIGSTYNAEASASWASNARIAIERPDDAGSMFGSEEYRLHAQNMAAIYHNTSAKHRDHAFDLRKWLVAHHLSFFPMGMDGKHIVE